MKQLSIVGASALFLVLNACSFSGKFSGEADPLQQILATLKKDTLGAKVLKNSAQYEVQIIYTQIERDALGRPSFHAYGYQLDSTRYFYPASMVKLPLALLSLEKINKLCRGAAPNISKNTPYRLDSLRAYQQAYNSDPGAPGGMPSIAHDIRQILTVSDNLAYNHCFEFLGREYINNTLKTKGYTRTGIVHRFNYPGRDNRYASPITFMEPGVGIYREAEKWDANTWINPQHSTQKGKGFINNADSLLSQPFDFARKNWFALTDMEKMLRAVLFPEAVPAQNRFDLTEEDYRFLWHYMGIFPRECDFPKYDTSYYDGYAKFFLFGDTKARQNGSVRVFNKIGEAYGTLTDMAYIVDFDHQVEFILGATILCNADGIFNDDQYEYTEEGLPFLAKLGRATLEFERKKRGQKAHKQQRSGLAGWEKYRDALR